MLLSRLIGARIGIPASSPLMNPGLHQCVSQSLLMFQPFIRVINMLRSENITNNTYCTSVVSCGPERLYGAMIQPEKHPAALSAPADCGVSRVRVLCQQI